MSSFLKLKLTIAKKPWWKSLTSKIHRKLNKKPKSTAKLPSNKRPNKYKFFTKSRFQRKNKKPRLVILESRDQSPVYVDKLFRDTQSLINVVIGDEKKRLSKESQVGDGYDCGVDRTAVEASTSADDMWESMGLASPLMRGIDARAEEFIAKFRADMEVQEMLARGL